MIAKQLPLFNLNDVTIENGRIDGPLGDAPLVVSCGIGINTIAMLIGLYKRGIRPAANLFSNPGNEFLYTYVYLSIIAMWLVRVEFPPITIVRYTPQRFKHHRYATLGGNCLANRTLPSLAFGRKSCSLKWKGEVLDRKVTELFGKTACYRAIGYDCSPRDNRRFAHANGRTPKSRSQDHFIYPLQLWGWDRPTCEQVILDAGLPSPGKSSCYFCPSMKPGEVDQLSLEHLCHIVMIEANASVNLRTVRGLWRDKRMTDYIREKSLLPEPIIERLWNRWSSEKRIITDPTTSAEDVLHRETLSVLAEFGLVLPLPSGKIAVQALLV